MANYATPTQYRETVNDTEAVEGSNVDNADAMVIDSSHLDRALTSASNQINAALAFRYTIPVYPAPPDLIRICIRIARWELAIHEITDTVQRQYDQAIADLNAYKMGTILVGSDNKPVPIKPVDPSQASYGTIVGQRKAGNEWTVYPSNVPVYPERGMNYQRHP